MCAGVSISKAVEALSNTNISCYGLEGRGKENKVLILFSLIPTKNKARVLSCSLYPELLPHSVLPRWPGALFLHSAEDTEHYSTDELIFMLLFLKPKAGGIR